jgi:DNA-binding response OmpR family regulator
LGCRVLVIEDDEALSALIAAWLNESGMTVTRAESVEAALYEIAWKNFER